MTGRIVASQFLLRLCHENNEEKVLLEEREVKLLNAFSLQMLTAFPAVISIEEVFPSADELREMESFVGHQDTARVLGVKFNRANSVIGPGESAIVAQLMGGRLPEGATSLPEGFKFKFFRVSVS